MSLPLLLKKKFISKFKQSVYFSMLFCLFFLTVFLECSETKNTHYLMMKMVENKPVHEQFKVWHLSMNKPYDLNSDYGVNRFLIFKENHEKISRKNSEQSDFSLGLGPFADMSFEEFHSKYLMKHKSVGNSKRMSGERENKLGLLSNSNNNTVYGNKNYYKNDSVLAYFDKMADIIDEIDNKEIFHRKNKENGDSGIKDNLSNNFSKQSSNDSLKFLYNEQETSIESKDWSILYSTVRDQKTCGSCWAFATTAVIEAFYKINDNNQGGFQEVSTQQLLDCSGEGGCEGGWYDEAFEYLKNKDSIAESDYPYENKKGVCK